MILPQETSINRNGTKANSAATVKTNISFRNVSPQASLSMGRISQKKWLMKLEPQKGREKIWPVWPIWIGIPLIQEPATSQIHTLQFMTRGYCRGLQMAAQRSQAITARRKHSVAPSVRMKHICVAQATREIVLLCVQRLVSILGSVNRHVADFQKGKIAKEKIHESGDQGSVLLSEI